MVPSVSGPLAEKREEDIGVPSVPEPVRRGPCAYAARCPPQVSPRIRLPLAEVTAADRRSAPDT